MDWTSISEPTTNSKYHGSTAIPLGLSRDHRANQTAPAVAKVITAISAGPRFVDLCRQMGLLATASVAIDGSTFKAVNNRDKTFTRGRVERRRAQLEESVTRYLDQLDTADPHEPTGPWR